MASAELSVPRASDFLPHFLRITITEIAPIKTPMRASRPLLDGPPFSKGAIAEPLSSALSTSSVGPDPFGSDFVPVAEVDLPLLDIFALKAANFFFASAAIRRAAVAAICFAFASAVACAANSCAATDSSVAFSAAAVWALASAAAFSAAAVWALASAAAFSASALASAAAFSAALASVSRVFIDISLLNGGIGNNL